MPRTMTSDQEKWFVANYPDMGSEQCAKHLGLPYATVRRRAYKMKLRLTSKRESEIRCQTWGNYTGKRKAYVPKIPIGPVNLPMTPQSVYTMGLIWADGCVTRKSQWRHEVSLTMVTEDAVKAFPDLNNVMGRWNYYRIKPAQPHHKEQTKAVLTGSLFRFFVDTGFPDKSGGNQHILLSSIPKELHHYYWLGYVDGDGCFYVGRTSNQFSITSTYDQDWSCVEELFRELGIEHHAIQRAILSSGRHSKVRVTNRRDLRILIGYLYQGDHEIGLKRKRDIAIEIAARPDRVKRGTLTPR